MAMNPQTKSCLFQLPPETRLHIYSCLIPNNTLHIDLCATRRPDHSTFFGVRRRSPISTLCQQLNALNEITHINGLHLLLVCRRTQYEVLQLFSKTTVRFHCLECFKTFLPNVARGLGVGVEWMKHVEVIFDVTKTRQMGRGQHLTPALAKTMAREATLSCQKVGWSWYGPLYLRDAEKWCYEPLREDKGDDDSSMRSGSTSGGWQQQLPTTSMAALVMPMGHGVTNPSGMELVPTKWLISATFDI